MNDKTINLKNNEQAYRNFEVDGHFFEQTIKFEAWPHEYGDGYIVQTICPDLEYSEHGYESTVTGIQTAVRLANRQECKAKTYVERLGKSQAAKALENDGWEITVDV